MTEHNDELLLSDGEIGTTLSKYCELSYPAAYWDSVLLYDFRQVAKSQLEKARPIIEKQLREETEAISYSRGVLDGRKQERERIINWVNKITFYDDAEGKAAKSMARHIIIFLKEGD